jgi:butyryl-CoA dehydrogenase
MEFELSAEHQAFRQAVRGFAESEIGPHAERWDRDHTFPTETVLAMGDLGLFGLPFPEEYGGSDADFTTVCIAIEEVARVDSSMAITLEAAVCLGAAPIAVFGDADQRARWLPDLCAGRALAGFGLTEPDAGATRAPLARVPFSTATNG